MSSESSCPPTPPDDGSASARRRRVQGRQPALRQAELLRAASAASGPERDRLIDDIVAGHLALADTLCRRYVRRGDDAEELQQVARLGLVVAAEHYEPDREGDFVAVAVPTILGELKRYLRDRAWPVAGSTA